MIRVLHFADAHIDTANYGRHDPETGLPLRVMDFLKSLDEIVQTAIDERVDLVIFAGDAYKDRSPAPTFQREWDQRIMRLSDAGIPTLLLTGNHDVSPSTGRAHALQEFASLNVPHVQVINKPTFLKPEALDGLPVQVLAMPWVSRSGMMANLDMTGVELKKIYEQLGEKLGELVSNWLDEADPNLPIILTAHASVEGAQYGNERMVMLGRDLVLPPSLVKDIRLDYVALGHIHKPQNLNENAHPPVIYPGSIERVDFGEVKDKKFFVIAEVEKGHTRVDWRELANIRRFIDLTIQLKSDKGINPALQKMLFSEGALDDAIVRMKIEYPREYEPLIDEAALRKAAESAFEFHLVKRPLTQARGRLPEGVTADSISDIDLLNHYWDSSEKDMDKARKGTLNQLAKTIIDKVNSGE